MMIKMNIKVDLDDLIDNLNEEELFELIKRIDLDVASYDFTSKLRNYFNFRNRKRG